MRTRAIYLGSAEHILHCVQQTRQPLEVTVRHFGLIAAAYQTAQHLELPQLLEAHLPGSRGGVARWIYFFVTVINRLDQATSKNKMSGWLKRTILPQLLEFDPAQLTSKNFWYATDDILSEREVREQREKEPDEEALFAGIDDSVFTTIEAQLFQRIDQLIGLSPQMICYDTTNFYTYIEDPPRSALAKSCHSKNAQHHRKHVGLLMAVDGEYGIPLSNRVYRANGHDSKVFSLILSDLLIGLRQLCGEVDLTLVLDKGNNKKETFNALYGHVSWIGSLPQSYDQVLMERPLSDYQGVWKGRHYYRCEQQVMSMPCVMIVLFNPATKRK